jgi:hypothetical protein
MVRVFNDTFIQLYRCGKIKKILVEKIGVIVESGVKHHNTNLISEIVMRSVCEQISNPKREQWCL